MRIRTIKPEFFRHEELQDCEAANAGKYPMLVFAGLWGHCDKAGRFEWKPRTLKLDILPFLNFEMDETLAILENAGFLSRYEVDGKQFGLIKSFQDHQRITGKELEAPCRFPEPPKAIGSAHVKQRGNIGETPEKHSESQEGKGREGNGVRAKSRASPKLPCPQEFEVTEPMAQWAEAKGLPADRVMTETEKFIAHHRSKDSRFSDWRHAWQSWIFKAVEYGGFKGK